MSSSRHNAFDLIRHVAALAVLVSHHFTLSGLEAPALGSAFSLGTLAVLAFFSISGYLVTLSFCRSATLGDYLAKRVSRLFPALILCALLMVYLAAPLLSERGVQRLFDFRTLMDFLRISAMGPAQLEDVTQGFIFPLSFNGSLWTLKIEFACYLAIAGLLSLMRGAAVPLFAALLLAALTAYLSQTGLGEVAGKLATYTSVMSAFFLGAFLAFKRHWLARREVLLGLIASGGALFVLAGLSAWHLPLGSLAVCLVTLGTGLLFNDRLIAGRFDLSYGIYLYAFPVQQIVINRLAPGFGAGMLLTVLLVVSLAALSWRTVEQPALRWAHRRTNRVDDAKVLGTP